eukprot:Skav210786  [mRNA]  locus=scaffold275:77649:80448:+ [translate_table: standard]
MLAMFAATCAVRGDIPEVPDCLSVLTIGLFDGVGALRVAADSAGLPVCGHISIEKNAAASRVLESKFPATQFYDDVEKITLATVQDWACQYGNAAIIIVGAGPPCQGVSGLNVNRRGALRDVRSKLYIHVPRIRDLVAQVFYWAQVHYLAESVASMDTDDCWRMSSAFGDQPYEIDASGVSLARRPRLYWCSWELREGQGVTITPPSSTSVDERGVVKLGGQLVEADYLTPGWTRGGTGKLPTFTTSRPRDHPGRRPAGEHTLTPEEHSQWRQDRYRFPPYQYQSQRQLWKGDQHRLCNIEEREAIMGFPRNYTLACYVKSRQGSIEHTDERLTLIGNSWNVTVVTWLLAQLGSTLGVSPLLTPQNCIDRTKPRADFNLPTFLARPKMARSTNPVRPGNELELVRKLLNMVSIKGEDLLLSSATEDNLKAGQEAQMGPKVRVHMDGRSKQARQQQRKELGPLRGLTVQPKTRERYTRALDKFFLYLRQRDLVLPQRKALLDPMISDYLEYLWSTGEGRSLASDSIAALQDREPGIKGWLGGSWRLLKTWATHEVPNRAPPLTEEALQTLAGHALFHGQSEFALSLLLGFYGLLRTGEFLGLKNGDISQSSPTSVAVISLGFTKGGQRLGASESVAITEEDTLRRLWQWKQIHAKGDMLCSSPYAWRKQFNDTVDSLGLSDFQYRPYSLRRGGATFYLQRHGQLDRLLIQGRWQSSRTARLYLNDGLAILAEKQLKLAPHARVFHRQFLRSRSLPLPQLERATKGSRAGGNGKQKSISKQGKKGWAGQQYPWFGGA